MIVKRVGKADNGGLGKHSCLTAMGIALCWGGVLMMDSVAQDNDATDARRRKQEYRVLKRLPDADLNKDGRVSESEARRYFLQWKVKQKKKHVAPAKRIKIPKPDIADEHYGSHERHVFDLWHGDSKEKLRPLIVFFHGGGFVGGDKNGISDHGMFLVYALENGYSVASVNYRLEPDAALPEILRDCGRAIQFFRQESERLKIDPAHIGVFGNSSGGSVALWLAFRDDLAETDAMDPVENQSSRVKAAAALNAQFGYDFSKWEKIVGVSREDYVEDERVFRLYHCERATDFMTPEGKEWLRECDVRNWVTPDDPPVFLFSSNKIKPPENAAEYIHHPNHMSAIHKRCRETGVYSRHIALNGVLPVGKSIDQHLAEFLFSALHREKKEKKN